MFLRFRVKVSGTSPENDRVRGSKGWTGTNVISSLFDVGGTWVVGDGLGVTQGGCLTPDEKK